MEMPAVVDEELVYLQECAQPIQMSCVKCLAILLELPRHKHTFFLSKSTKFNET